MFSLAHPPARRARVGYARGVPRVLASATCLALALLLTGCGGDAPPVSRPSSLPIPDGFTRVGGLSNGLVMAIPSAWRSVDLSKTDFEAELAASGLSGTALEQAKTSLRALQKNKALYAMDPASQAESPGKFVTNLNGFCQPSVGASADALIDLAKQQLASIKATVSEATSVPLGNGTAVRIRYTLPMAGTVIHGTQFYAPSDKGRTCVVTLSTDLTGKEALFNQIGSTIRPV
ncbi:hypothetical protein Aph01nite_48040 [Acrocarpospora phusangensis]|uniref:Uncharacterized protein n=1 Tax=Acrocarpospora phusangensis TaxID=1070424 RepID=A0A919ULZ9_9ACTN|nr:hypothetical protein [Acrocarpospora phusangensis]GIH26494.1 hypothetical protein Aph01nite_48040 [Acrocarpospora phusangensis]